METLYRSMYLDILLHPGSHATLELSWKDFVPSADFRACITEFVRLARQYQAKALVVDNRLMRALRQADLQWGGEQVFGVLNELGSQRFAAVESLDAMNRMGVKMLVTSAQPHAQFTTQFFSSLEEARAWATARL